VKSFGIYHGNEHLHRRLGPQTSKCQGHLTSLRAKRMQSERTFICRTMLVHMQSDHLAEGHCACRALASVMRCKLAACVLPTHHRRVGHFVSRKRLCDQFASSLRYPWYCPGYSWSLPGEESRVYQVPESIDWATMNVSLAPQPRSRPHYSYPRSQSRVAPALSHCQQSHFSNMACQSSDACISLPAHIYSFFHPQCSPSPHP
jgi:hypothetical protein